MSNIAVNSCLRTGCTFLVFYLGLATVLAAQDRNSPQADGPEGENGAIGFRCPDRESNHPRPDVKWRLGDITKKALKLPRPAYTKAARTARVSGNVRAEVVILIMTGEVVWARVLDGNPLLQEAVKEVVCRARFSHVNDVNGHVSGVLTYKFPRRR